MDFLTLFGIALGLSMDAFAVSISCGLRKQIFLRKIRMPIFFGFFQGLMPMTGWVLVRQFHHHFQAVDHWIAFGLLSLVGGHMLYEAKNPHLPKKDPFHWPVLLMLAIATSIDAFAIGLSLGILHVTILTPVIVIGIITFGVSFLGLYIGKTIGCRIQGAVDVVGGLLLVGIGIKIFLEHLLKGI